MGPPRPRPELGLGLGPRPELGLGLDPRAERRGSFAAASTPSYGVGIRLGLGLRVGLAVGLG